MWRKVSEIQTTRMFQGGELTRLFMMLLMLGLMAMAIPRIGDQGFLRTLGLKQSVNDDEGSRGEHPAPPGKRGAVHAAAAAPGHGKPAPASQPAPNPAAPAVTGGTGAAAAKPDKPAAADAVLDDEPEETDQMRVELQAVEDKTLKILPQEMLAYRRTLRWVCSQPWEMIRRRAKTNLGFHQFYTAPDDHRGELVTFPFHIRMVRRWDEYRGPNDEELAELWGYTDESGDHLYDVVVVDLPKDIPNGDVNEEARIAGYFFKLQGYEPRGESGNARSRSPLVAPLVIGRMHWIPQPKPQTSGAYSNWWVVVVVITLVVVGFGGFLVAGMRQRPLPAAAPVPGTPTLDEWLEQPDGDERPSPGGNNFSGNGDSSSGESDHSEAGDEGPPASPGDLRTMRR